MQIHSIIDPRIESGTVDGQMMFWDGTRWVHTEVSKLFWDDTAKRFTATGMTVTGSSVLGLNSVVFQPNADSTTFLQVLDQDGGTPILNIDTTNERVGIKTANPLGDLQIDMTMMLQNVISSQVNLAENAYFDGSVWKYMTTSHASAVRMWDGNIQFHSAPSGTAGDAITNWDTSDVKMVIKSDGNVGINTVTPDAKFELAGDMLFTGASSGLPFGEISVVSNATETAIATQNVYVQITTFDTNGESNNVTPDHTNDHITITKAGRYFISCSITLNSIGGSGSTAEMEVQKNNGNARVGSLHMDRTLSGGGTESGAITMTGIANLSVDDTIEVWIKNETNTQNYVVEDITLSLMQKGG